MLHALFAGSVIAGFIARESAISRIWGDSAAFRFADGLVGLPQRIFHPLYKKSEDIFRQSLLFGVIVYILDRLHLLVAFFLFFALVARGESWNNLYSTVILVFLLLLYFLRTVIDGETGFYLKVFNVFLLLFVVCVILAEIFSIMPKSSLRFLAFYLTCFILVLLLMATIRTREQLTAAMFVILAGMTLCGLYGIYQNFKGVPVNPSWVDTTVNAGTMSRVYSTFMNPNNFAEIIVLLLPFYLAAAFNAKGLFMKLLYLALAVPPFISLLLTLSRSAWIGFAVAFLVYVFFKEKKLIPVFILLGLGISIFTAIGHNAYKDHNKSSGFIDYHKIECLQNHPACIEGLLVYRNGARK